MNLNLSSRSTLVTAGSKGIGRAIAVALAAEGARVAISARGAEALNATVDHIRASGGICLPISGDVSNPDDIRRMVSATASEFGGIDVLVINAGGPPAIPFAEADDEQWQSAFELTVMSAVRLIREARPFLADRAGRVVCIQSISVKQPVTGLLLSNSLRSAVVGLLKTLADELAGDQIRLNTILPGMILTDRTQYLAESRAKAAGRTREEVLAETAQAIPLKRYGDPAELANLAVFLASDASSYLTGTSILCDGGLFRGLM